MPSSERNEPYFLNEDALMANFRQGEGVAFRYIFDMMARPLAYFVENIVYSKLEAEDIVANSFSKLYYAKGNMKSLEHIKRSLYVMAKNESIDFLRHKSRLRQSEGELHYLSHEFESRIETERIKAVHFQTVLSEIEKLPNQRRKIIKLYFFQQKTTSEIAEALGLNTQTVLNHKAKALQALRENLPHFKEMSALVAVLYIIGRIYLSS